MYSQMNKTEEVSLGNAKYSWICLLGHPNELFAEQYQMQIDKSQRESTLNASLNRVPKTKLLLTCFMTHIVY